MKHSPRVSNVDDTQLPFTSVLMGYYTRDIALAPIKSNNTWIFLYQLKNITCTFNNYQTLSLPFYKTKFNIHFS